MWRTITMSNVFKLCMTKKTHSRPIVLYICKEITHRFCLVLVQAIQVDWNNRILLLGIQGITCWKMGYKNQPLSQWGLH